MIRVYERGSKSRTYIYGIRVSHAKVFAISTMRDLTHDGDFEMPEKFNLFAIRTNLVNDVGKQIWMLRRLDFSLSA